MAFAFFSFLAVAIFSLLGLLVYNFAAGGKEVEEENEEENEESSEEEDSVEDSE